MIAEIKSATVAYRCPHCGASVIAVIDQYTLGQDLVKLRCECGESELVLQRVPGGKIRLTVPCIVCPQDHTYLLSGNSFFDRDLFTFACTYTGVDICFFGEREKVLRRLEESESEILEMLGDTDPTSLPHGNDRYDEFFASHISDVVSYMLAELNDEGKLHCRCPEGEGEYVFESVPEGIRISCEKCGAKKDLEVTGLVSADDLLGVDEVTLL